jgi:hypothetical protein
LLIATKIHSELSSQDLDNEKTTAEFGTLVYEDALPVWGCRPFRAIAAFGAQSSSGATEKQLAMVDGIPAKTERQTCASGKTSA